MAVNASFGAEAERIPPSYAIQEIKRGNHFTPSPPSFLGHKYASDYGLTSHLYYRQAGLFVHFLRTFNRTAFDNSFKKIIGGEDFLDAIHDSYQADIYTLWNKFLDGVESTNG